MHRTYDWMILWIAIGTLCAGSATAEIFRWTDASGREHFTSDFSRVPAAHRRAVKAAAEKKPGARATNLNLIRSSQRGAKRGTAAPAPPRGNARSASTTDPKTTTQVGGHDEAWWRERTRSQLQQIEQLETTVERCEQMSPPVRHNPATGWRMKRQHYDRKLSAADDCSRSSVELDARRRQLENFRESARRKDVPPGWLR